MTKKNIICVLGMHRSGTSLLTRLINLMGVYVGKDEELMEPKPDNVDGFWEYKKIVSIHDQILNVFGLNWSSDTFLPNGWEKNQEVQKYKYQLIEIIDNDFEKYTSWAFKDPRTSILIEMWKEIFREHEEFEPIYIVCVRNPYNVAESLKKRDRFHLNYGLKLWMNYNCSLFQSIYKEKNVHFFVYDDVLEKKEKNILKLSNAINMKFGTEKKESINEHIKTDLRHFMSENHRKTCMPQFIENIYLELKAIAKEEKIDKTSLEKLSLMFTEYKELYSIASEKRMNLQAATLFYDIGEGYSEKYKIKAISDLNSVEQMYEAKFVKLNEIKKIVSIRFDPVEGQACRIKIIDIISDMKIKKIRALNATEQPYGWDCFYNIDPMYEIDGEFSQATFISIKFKLIPEQTFNVIKKLNGIIAYKEQEVYKSEKRLDESRQDLRLAQCQILNIQKQLEENGKEKLVIEERLTINSQDLKEEKEKNRLLKLTLEQKFNELKLEKQINSELEKNVARIKNSWSWKLTKPLRAIKRYIVRYKD